MFHTTPKKIKMVQFIKKISYKIKKCFFLKFFQLDQSEGTVITLVFFIFGALCYLFGGQLTNQDGHPFGRFHSKTPEAKTKQHKTDLIWTYNPFDEHTEM